MMLSGLYRFLTVCGLATATLSAGAQVSVPEPTDSLTAAAASILGMSLKASVDNIEGLGVSLDRAQLKKIICAIIDGDSPVYSYDRAYAIMDSGIAERQRSYVDSVFSAESQQAFLDKAAAEEGAVRTPSGLVFQVITEGEGVTPAKGDDVVVTYVGKLSDGSVFDRADSPVRFDVDRLVPGFSAGLKLMKPGGRYRIVIPASLGYGERGVPGNIPSGATLDFLVDLLEIVPKPSGQ